MSMWFVLMLAYVTLVVGYGVVYGAVKLVISIVRRRRKTAELCARMDRLLGPPLVFPTGRHRICPSTPSHATASHYLRLARLD